MQASVEKRWNWTGKTRRHTVFLRHNTLSGGQHLEVDGELLHAVRWKYKLTGTLYFNLDDAIVELYIRADELGNLRYVLTVDAKEVPLHEDRVVSTWVVSLPDGLHQVEFEHKSYDILVDSEKVEALGDFIDEGSAYCFTIGESNAEATLVVIPATDRKSSMRTTLTVNGVEVSQSETLGAEGSPVVMPGAAGAAGDGDWGRVEVKTGGAAAAK